MSHPVETHSFTKITRQLIQFIPSSNRQMSSKFRVSHLVVDWVWLSWILIDPLAAQLCLGWWKLGWQKGPGCWARWWNTQIKVNPTKVYDQMVHLVLAFMNFRNNIKWHFHYVLLLRASGTHKIRGNRQWRQPLHRLSHQLGSRRGPGLLRDPLPRRMVLEHRLGTHHAYHFKYIRYLIFHHIYIYRVTHQVVLNPPLTPKSFCACSSY